MKITSLALVLAALILPATAAAKTIRHVVLEDETAWFLAHVYYGSGKLFTKLLSANHLTRAEDMKVGMEIQIEDPRFSKDQPRFNERYNHLWAARQKALGLTKGKELPISKVIIPTENIRHKDKTQKLPFSEVNEASHSAADPAKEERE